MPTSPRSLVRAAGCVVWRYGSDEPEVLVVHRPRWNDWTFPKGKLEPGEAPIVAAVREVEEETGLRVWLGPRLRDDHYVISSGQPKIVSYWCAQPPRKADITRYQPNDEIDQVEWFSLTKARAALSYPRDVDLLGELTLSTFDSSVLLVVRHAEAHKRKTWHHEDPERPLSAEGRRTAERLAPIFAAYGITRVVTSDAARCVETMLPFVNGYDVKSRLDSGLSEEHSTKKSLSRAAATALNSDKRIAICTHRPVLPGLCAALGIGETPLEPGGMIVIHRAKGKVRSVEKPE
jgi:8-oxo-dGTP pyrophosphatase MutT (NUDIX family)/phosphohistidine phosphatase SixA